MTEKLSAEELQELRKTHPKQGPLDARVTDPYDIAVLLDHIEAMEAELAELQQACPEALRRDAKVGAFVRGMGQYATHYFGKQALTAQLSTVPHLNIIGWDFYVTSQRSEEVELASADSIDDLVAKVLDEQQEAGK